MPHARREAIAAIAREFDLVNKKFLADGFYRPEAKGALGWKDADTVYVYTDFGAGSLTSSGYPRIVKEWKRGTPLDSAKVVYEGKPDDMYIAAYHDDTPGFQRDFVSRTLAFYNDELYLRRADGTLAKIDAPNSANKGVFREWLTLELREPWTVGGTTYAAGSLLAAKFDDFMAGTRTFDVLFEPTMTTSLAGMSVTKNHVVLNVLDDDKNRLSVLTPSATGWKRSEFVGAPGFGTISVSAVDADWRRCCQPSATESQKDNKPCLIPSSAIVHLRQINSQALHVRACRLRHLDVDLARLRMLGLRNAQLEYTLVEFSCGFLAVELPGQGKYAPVARQPDFGMARFHAFRRIQHDLAFDGQAVCFQLQTQLVLGHARHVGIQGDAGSILDHIDRGQQRGFGTSGFAFLFRHIGVFAHDLSSFAY